MYRSPALNSPAELSPMSFGSLDAIPEILA